ncbi:hypothetical protein GVAV_003066 [Gurleya vavrai]
MTEENFKISPVKINKNQSDDTSVELNQLKPEAIVGHVKEFKLHTVDDHKTENENSNIIFICNHMEMIDLATIYENIKLYIYAPILEKLEEQGYKFIDEYIKIKNYGCEIKVDQICNFLHLIFERIFLDFFIKEYNVEENFFESYKMPYVEDPALLHILKNICSDKGICDMSFDDFITIIKNNLLVLIDHLRFNFNIFQKSIIHESRVLRLFQERHTLLNVRKQIKFVNKENKEFKLKKSQNIFAIDLQGKNIIAEPNIFKQISNVILNKTSNQKFEMINIYIDLKEGYDLFDMFIQFTSHYKKFKSSIDYNIHLFYRFKETLKDLKFFKKKDYLFLKLKKNLLKESIKVNFIYNEHSYKEIENEFEEYFLDFFNDTALKEEASVILMACHQEIKDYIKSMFVENKENSD